MDQTVSNSSDQQASFITLQKFLGEHPVFGTLSDTEIIELAREIEILTLQPGEFLFKQGDLDDSVYVVLMGSLEVRINSAGGGDIPVNQLIRGDIVGEIALITGQPRTATCAAKECTQLARLPNEGFARLKERNPRMIEELSRQVLPRFRHTQLISILMGIFREIDIPAFREIENQIAWKRLLPGDVLFSQGEPADAFYIVITGRLRIVVKDAEGDERIIGELGRGDFTGEFALLTGEPRSATVLAIRDTEVVSISLPVFDQLLTRHPTTMLHLTRLIIQRVSRFNRTQAARAATFSAITVVPIHPSVQIEAFSAKLFETLSKYGTVLQLSSSAFDDLYNRPGAAQTGADHPSDALIQVWLDEKESQYAYVIYQADRTYTSWTRRCLSRSDRVLLVGEAGLSPDLGEIEEMSAGVNPVSRRDLVLVHRQGKSCASGTKQWLAPRNVNSHYHVRTGIPQDFHRLARRLIGRATGVVLSGGGARGLAHVGVLQAMEEAGVEIDLIGGTSIGALFAGAYAYGHSIEDIINFLRIFSNREKVLDYTLPFTSLTTSRKVTELLHQVWGSAQIEDLCLPFFCVSSNLTRAEPMIHLTGPVWESVRASLAIPGIFTPMPLGEDVLVDGGVMNNFPINIMRDLCEGGFVIGVNVAPKRDSNKNFSFGPSVSGWQMLWDKVFPFRKRQNPPSILYSLMRTIEINDIYRLRFAKEAADLIIEPPVSQFGTLDFGKFEEIIAIGYQTARYFQFMKG